MAEVYVVTSGEYSSYSIDAIFATREAAEDYTGGGPRDDWHDDPRIEEWRIWEGVVPYVPSIWMDCRIAENGRVTEEARERRHYPDLQTGEPRDIPEALHVDKPRLWTTRPPYSFYFTVTGTDIKRVRKVYSERKAEYLARYELILNELVGKTGARRGEVEEWRASPWRAETRGIVPPSYQELFDAEWDRLFPDGQPDPDLA